jgi:hypothetical protein
MELSNNVAIPVAKNDSLLSCNFRLPALASGLPHHPLPPTLDLGWIPHILPRFHWLGAQFLSHSRDMSQRQGTWRVISSPSLFPLRGVG